MQRTYQLTLNGAMRLPEAVRARLMACSKPKKYADGSFVMREGDAADRFGIVTEGQLMIGRHADNGTLTVLAVIGPGDMFGEQAYLTQTPRIADAIADGPVTIVWISGAVFRRALTGDTELALLMMRSLAAQVKVAAERIDAGRRLTLDQRVASMLQSMCDVADGTIETTQQELADLVGVSRVALGEALRHLERSGAITLAYGRITIRNPGLLEAQMRLGGKRLRP